MGTRGKSVSMLLGEITEVKNLSVIYKNNQGENFLAKNRQVVIHTKYVDIHRHFLQDMEEDKDSNIQYIWSEDNRAKIMTNNTLEADFSRHTKRITDIELRDLLKTGRKNVKDTRVTDHLITRDKTEYSSHALYKVVDGKHKND